MPDCGNVLLKTWKSIIKEHMDSLASHLKRFHLYDIREDLEKLVDNLMNQTFSRALGQGKRRA